MDDQASDKTPKGLQDEAADRENAEPEWLEQLADADQKAPQTADFATRDRAIARELAMNAEYLRTVLGREGSIEEATLPLAIVACDLASGAQVVRRRGPLPPALMASAAILGSFRPVRLGGGIVVNGGVVANSDLEAFLAAHIRDAVLIDLQSPEAESELTGLRSIVDLAVTISRARQTELERGLLSLRPCAADGRRRRGDNRGVSGSSVRSRGLRAAQGANAVELLKT